MSTDENTILEENAWEALTNFRDEANTSFLKSWGKDNKDLLLLAEACESDGQYPSINHLERLFENIKLWDYEFCLRDTVSCLKSYHNNSAYRSLR